MAKTIDVVFEYWPKNNMQHPKPLATFMHINHFKQTNASLLDVFTLIKHKFCTSEIADKKMLHQCKYVKADYVVLVVL